MNITSISSTNGITAGKNTGRAGNFDAMLKAAMENHRPAGLDTTDTLELSTNTSAANIVSNSNKIDAGGQSYDSVTMTSEDREEFRKVFHQFVGQTLYGQMLKSMRETQQKPAYFHGGRAEEIFQGQLDQVIVDKMTAATSNSLDDAMFQLMPKM